MQRFWLTLSLALISSSTLGVLVSAMAVIAAGDDDIHWLLHYDGKTLPQEQGWTPVGGLASGFRIVEGALRITDD